MSNEVAKPFDDLFLDFIEEHKVQIWPTRTGHGKFVEWTVQCMKPFTQVAHENLKDALTKIADKLGDLRFKELMPKKEWRFMLTEEEWRLIHNALCDRQSQPFQTIESKKKIQRLMDKVRDECIAPYNDTTTKE